MILQGGRFVVRLPKLTLQGLGNRRTGLSSSRVERVPALYNVFQSQYYSNLVLKNSLIIPTLHRTYAQRAVSRPKAHTGRTTAVARKAPTTSKTKAAKKPAPNKRTPKAVPKAKSKAKPRIKPKPKPKPKPKVKKAKKAKKVLTEKQKSASTIKQLKETALKPPLQYPSNAWRVYFKEKMVGKSNLTVVVKEASAEFKQLAPERLEHYNHLANEHKAANARNYRQWVQSHTAPTIFEANLARAHLRRLGVKAPRLQDDRQVKGMIHAYVYFFQSRQQSGDLRGLKATEAAKLVGREWKALTASEKKPFDDLAAQDKARYTQERKTVLNKDVRNSDVPSRRSKT